MKGYPQPEEGEFEVFGLSIFVPICERGLKSHFNLGQIILLLFKEAYYDTACKRYALGDLLKLTF